MSSNKKQSEYFVMGWCNKSIDVLEYTHFWVYGFLWKQYFAIFRYRICHTWGSNLGPVGSNLGPVRHIHRNQLLWGTYCEIFRAWRSGIKSNAFYCQGVPQIKSNRCEISENCYLPLTQKPVLRIFDNKKQLRNTRNCFLFELKNRPHMTKNNVQLYDIL